MATYRVSFREQGTAESVWLLKKSGVVQDQFRRKRDAVKMAKRLAKSTGEKSKVIVEKKSGSTQNRFSYEGNESDGMMGGVL